MFDKKILIIEDEESISDLLCYSLGKEGFITKAAYNGKDGIRLVEEFKPDMIFMSLKNYIFSLSCT